jgi:hypothetical protein
VVKEAAILVEDGYFDANRVLERFLALSRELPPDIIAFVAAKLKAHPNFADE